jgi:hypothetical protein
MGFMACLSSEQRDRVHRRAGAALDAEGGHDEEELPPTPLRARGRELREGEVVEEWDAHGDEAALVDGEAPSREAEAGNGVGDAVAA